MRKRLITLLLAAAMVTSMAACNSGGGTASSGGTALSTSEAAPGTEAPAPGDANAIADVQANLRIIWWGSQTRHEATQAAIDVFTEKYPNITLTPEFVSWDGYWQKLATMSASKSLPDILQQDYKYMTQYAKNDLLVDLEPYRQSGILDLSQSPESMWDSGYVEGELVALCLGVNSLVTLVNSEMFEQAGIPIPSDDWTYEEYQEVCRQLMEKSSELGITYAEQGAVNMNYEGCSARLRQNGMYFFNQDGTNSFGFEKEAGKEIILEYIADMKNSIENKYEGPLSLRDEVEQNGIESGLSVQKKTAMALGIWSNQAKAVSNAAGFNFTIVAAPDKIVQEQKAQYIKPSQFFSVATNSEYKDQAVFFINAFTNDIDMNMKLQGERGVPISTPVSEALAASFEEGAIEKDVFEFVNRIAPKVSPTPAPEPSSFNVISQNLLKNLFKQIIDEGVDPDAAFESFYAQALTEFEMATE